MTSVSKETEVNGNTYEVVIREYSGGREVSVALRGDGYSVVRDTRHKENDRSFLDKILGINESEPYPDRSEHVADALNEAISKYENRLAQENEMRKEMQCAIDAAEVWESE